MKERLTLGITIFLLFISLSSYSQTINGKVVNAENEGIDFAHVFFLNDQAQGTVTNEIGIFSIQIEEENKSDTLVVSILGYETKYIPFDEWKKENQIIKLESSTFGLDEVIILSDNYYRYILKEAISKIPENYPTEKHLLKGYYQNYTISDTSYSELIEADFQLLSNGYNQKRIKENIFLSHLRKTEDNRNLPDSLKLDKNDMYLTLYTNTVYRRSLSRCSKQLGKLISFNDFCKQQMN